MSGELTLVFTCYMCGELAAACPECVVVVQVDPVTELPTDRAIVDRRVVVVIPDPEAVARSHRRPVCDQCVERRNTICPAPAPRWDTSEQRHARNHF